MSSNRISPLRFDSDSDFDAPPVSLRQPQSQPPPSPETPPPSIPKHTQPTPLSPPPPSPPSLPSQSFSSSQPLSRSETAAERREKKAQLRVTKLAAKQAEREAKRQAKEAEVRERRQARITRAFATHESSGVSRRDFVKILVHPDLFLDDSERTDPLSALRILFAHRLEQNNSTNIREHILWKRLRPNYTPLDVPDPPDPRLHALVYSADQYLSLIHESKLDDRAKSLRALLPSDAKIILVVPGLDRAHKLRMKRAANDPTATIYAPEALQDSFVYLQLHYRIRVHVFHDLHDVRHFLRDITSAIAAPCDDSNGDLVGASLQYFRKHAAVGRRAQAVTDSGEPSGVDDEEMCGFDATKKQTVRVEGPNDLGNLYMSMLCLVPMVSLQKACAIRGKYPTLRMLFEAYDACENEEQRDLLLADITFGRGGRRLGPALSKSIANVLNNRDSSARI